MKFQRVLVMFAVIVLISIVHLESVKASQTTSTIDFKYDADLYVVNQGERIYFTTYTKAGWLMRSDSGVTGTKCVANRAIVHTELIPVFYTSKHTIDGYFYQALGYKLDTTGDDYDSTYAGYPIKTIVKVGAVGAFDTMMTSYDIQPKISTGDTSYSIDGASLSGSVNLSKNMKDGWTVSGGASANFQIENSRSWAESCITLSPRKNVSNRAVWEYYYNASTVNKDVNIQLYSTNSFNGLISWKVKPGSSIVGGFDIEVSTDAGLVQKNSTIIGRYSSKWLGSYSYVFNSNSKAGQIDWR